MAVSRVPVLCNFASPLPLAWRGAMEFVLTLTVSHRKEVLHFKRSNALVGDGRCRLLTRMAKQRPERQFQVSEGD